MDISSGLCLCILPCHIAGGWEWKRKDEKKKEKKKKEVKKKYLQSMVCLYLAGSVFFIIAIGH